MSMHDKDSINENTFCETVLTNGYIYSVNLQGIVSTAQAVAINAGKILYVGDDKGINAYIGPNTRKFDLKGKMVLPGLSDAHIHPTMTTEMLDNCEMHYLESKYPDPLRLIEEYQNVLKNYIKENPNKEVIKGSGWNPQSFIGNANLMPTAATIDKVCSDKPVVLRSVCEHYIWANSKAMAVAGITKSSQDPPKGIVWRDKDGNPLGIFQELTAIDHLIKNIPGYDCTVLEYKHAIKKYQETLASNYGITLIFDALGTENAYQAYKELAQTGELNLRVRGCYYADPSLPYEQFDKILSKKGTDSIGDLFQCNTVKFFMDGSGQSFYLNEPFTKETIEGYGVKTKEGAFDYSYRGYPQWDLEAYPEKGITLATIFERIQKSGFQMHFHSMGDGATTQILDIYEKLDKDMVRKNRNTIAHLMLVKENDIKRMAEMDIIAAVQPWWFTYDSWVSDYYGTLFGPERVENLYPMKSFLDAGVRIASGSDLPVNSPASPIEGIQMGMERTITPDMSDYSFEEFRRPLGPDSNPRKECVTFKDMVQSLSINCAYECFLSDTTGSIEVGKSADLVVLDKDLTKVDVKEIYKVPVAMTFFKGNIVYKQK